METFWYIALTFMFIMYVILDGFDLGSGIIHFFIGKTETERRTLLNAIGPFWDGNEVWLVAAGGTLYFAFPKLYASSFSGFYLPLIMLLWLLILRALGIELREHLQHTLWKKFWDRIFFIASLLVTLILGAALGNILRGVPLNEQGYFFQPLWTTFTIHAEPGIFDWYTLLFALVAVSTLTAHGANYLALKTEHILQNRSREIAKKIWYATTGSSILAIIATFKVRTEYWQKFIEHPWGVLFPVLAIAGLIGMYIFNRQRKDLQAFLASMVFIFGMGASTAFGLYPTMLPSSTDPALSLTIFNTAASRYGLRVGLLWWIIGIVLAGGYFTYLFYSFRGKIKSASGEGGY